MKQALAVLLGLLLISSVESSENVGLRGHHHRHRHHHHNARLAKAPNLPAAAIPVEQSPSGVHSFETMPQSFAYSDGNGVRSVETMVEGLAGQSAKQGVTPEMDTFVKQIDKMLTDDMKPKIIGSHDEAQLLLNNFVSAVATCGDQKQQKDVEINSAIADRTTKSAAYKECRRSEAILVAPKQACDNALEALKNAKQIACNNALLKTAVPDEGVCSPGSGATYGSWIEAKAELFATKLKEYKEAEDGCTSATQEVDYKIPVCEELATDVNTKKAECDNAQQLLESAACAQAEKTSTACETYTLCHENALIAYNNAKPGIVQQEKDRKGEWRGLMRIQCLLGVFSDGGGSGVNTGQIDTCKAKTHDTTHLDLVYPTLAGPSACIVGGTEPCLADYIDAEYSSVPPEAPGKECTPCAWNTPTTTTTTTTTTRDNLLMLDLDASRGASAVSSVLGTNFGSKSLVTVDGVPYWNLDGTYMQQQGSSGEWTVGQEYTHCAWIRWRESNNGWRTLFRGSSDHAILVQAGGRALGMFSNRNGGFRSSGFDITIGTLQFVCAVGRGDSASSSVGTTTFYLAVAGSDGPQQVGTADRVVSGTSVYRIGWPGQGPGKVAMIKFWNKALSQGELLSVFRQGTATGAPAGLTCPPGSEQVGALNADVGGCGLESCDQRYTVTSIEACKTKCAGNSACRAFNWAPLGGDKNHVDTTTCTLYSQEAPTSMWGPNQIFCKLMVLR